MINENNKIPLIIICGPTASGKTALSVDLAKALDGEIISADSMQIYKYMDIGSAKPTMEEREGIPHYMMDIISPVENFSVNEYCTMAHGVIGDITSRGKLPIMVGGTGLYIDSVAKDTDFAEQSDDGDERKKLMLFYEQNGRDALYNMLCEIDFKASEVIHPNNVRRVIRAIEFYNVTGKRFSEHADEGAKKESRYRPVYIDIEWDRDILYERIDRRVDIMFDLGLENEVRHLIDMGCTSDMTSMQGIGYKETVNYINGLLTLDEAKEEIKQSSRRYAKRQLTWFRRNKDIKHISPSNAFDEALKYINEWRKE